MTLIKRGERGIKIARVRAVFLSLVLMSVVDVFAYRIVVSWGNVAYVYRDDGAYLRYLRHEREANQAWDLLRIKASMSVTK